MSKRLGEINKISKTKKNLSVNLVVCIGFFLAGKLPGKLVFSNFWKELTAFSCCFCELLDFFGVCPKDFRIASQVRNCVMNFPCCVFTNVVFVCVGYLDAKLVIVKFAAKTAF